MRRATFVIALLVCGSATAEVFKLSNGLTVLVDPKTDQPRVAAELWFRAGSAYESPEQAGIAHLMEHAFPRCALRSDPANLQTYNEASLDSNAQTKSDYSRYYVEFTSNALDLFLGCLAQRMSAPPDAIKDDILERHKQIVLAEMRNARGRRWDPEVLDPVRRQLWGASHPYGHTAYGTEASVKSISADTLRQWFAEHHSPVNAFLLVSGDVTVSDVRASAEKWFGSIPAGQRVKQFVVATASGAHAQTDDTFYFRGPRYGDRDADLLTLLLLIVGARRDAEIDVDLRELGSEYSITGKELERALLRRITPAEVSAAKEAFRRGILESLDRLGWQDSRIELMGQGLLFRGDADFYKERLARVDRASATEIENAAKRWLTREERPQLPAVQRKTIEGVNVIVAVRPQTPLAAVLLVPEEPIAIAPLRKTLRATGASVEETSHGALISVAQPHLATALAAVARIPAVDLIIVSCRDPGKILPRAAQAHTSVPPLAAGRSLILDPALRDARLSISLPFQNAVLARAAEGLLRQKLQRVLREEKGWTYNVSSSVAANAVTFNATMEPRFVADAVRAAEPLIASPDIAIDPIKLSVRHELMNAISSTTRLASYLADLAGSRADDPLAERAALIESLSADVLTAAIHDAAARAAWLVRTNEPNPALTDLRFVVSPAKPTR